MKKIQVTAPHEIVVVDADIPKPAPGEALLKVLFAGICGSDLQTFTGNQPFATYPRVPGHEWSGEIVEFSGPTSGLRVGQLVTGNPYFNCTRCYSCRRGLVNCCESNETMGVHRDGSFQEYITMPIERLYPADGLDPRFVAMVEPFSIGWHAMNRARVTGRDRVLILGAGAIGMLTMVSSLVRGAEVHIGDVVPERLEIARRVGAASAVDLRETSIADLVASATDGDGFDVVGEATGLPVSFLNAIEASAFGGRIALIGNGKREVSFNQSLLIKKELDVLGARNSLDAFPPLIKLLRDGVVDLSPILTSIVPAAQTVYAMRDLLDHAANNVKVLIEF